MMKQAHSVFSRLLLLVALVLAISACSQSSSQSSRDPGSAMGAAAAADDSKEDLAALGDQATMDEAFSVARSVLYGEPAGNTATLTALSGRRVFICAYQDKPRSICATDFGANLEKSVHNAAEALKSRAAEVVGADRKDGIRLKIDFVTSASATTFKRKIEKLKKREIGMYGYWVTSGTEVSWILPTEVLELGLYSDRKGKKGVPRKSIIKALAKRNPGLGELAEEFSYDKLRTTAWVEDDQAEPGRPGIFRMFRLHTYEFDTITPDLLLQRTVWAADYLISSIAADGKIRYRYDPATDKDSSSYNLLRHGGTTYSILQAYDRTKFQPYLEASKAAIRYLFKNSRREERVGPFGGGDSMYVVESPFIKLGGSGLGLVMLDQYAEATGDRETFIDESRAYARFLVSQLKEDGEFVYFAPLKVGGKPKNETSAYYPGEAILGLIRLYSWDRNPLWLDTATRAADWLIHVRDKGKDEKRLANDHWLMIALSYLYQYTKREDYLFHSLALARSVEHQYKKNLPTAKKYRDYRGGYYDPPRSTPAATRGEGLVAVLDTCNLAGKTCDWVKDMLLETVRHENLSQYDPKMNFWMKNRKKAFGGWNGGITDPKVRNDYVQHNMSSILGTERHLRAADNIKLPGGPIWTEENLKGATHPGVPATDMDALRTATMRYRGKTQWEN